MADLTFVSRRDSSFKEFPPASAQIAMVIPFYGDLTVWVRSPDAGGWHFPTSQRRSGETILEVARRELWDSARIVASRLDLLGAIRYELPKPTTAYVYMCELQHLTWWYEIPEKEKSAEVGVFTRLPRPVASEAVELVLEAALRARREVPATRIGRAHPYGELAIERNDHRDLRGGWRELLEARVST